MAYTSAEARQDLLDAFAEAIEHIGVALADLGAAYELLDERNADRLEEELFGPVQRAYGRAKSTVCAVRRPPRDDGEQPLRPRRRVVRRSARRG